MFYLKYMVRVPYNWHNPSSLTYDLEQTEGPFSTKWDAHEWAACAGVSDYTIEEEKGS